ncbi:MAG: flagellar filament capping protein FliD [Terriglobales bacterium]
MATSDILNALSSSLGTGQGIDVTSTVNQLITNLRGPEQVWQTQQQILAGQSTALTQLNTEVTALSNAIDSLDDPAGALTSRAVTSSQPGLATATTSNSTPVGSHTVVVNNLASSASYYSGAVASSTTTLAAGSFTIQVGNQPANTITIDATNNTLDGLAAAITNANIGVTASVVNDSNGARLAIVSNASGAASDLTINNVDSGLTFTKGATGTDASLTVDGVPISSASNTISDTVAGLTLNLVGADPNTQVQIAVSPDTTKVTQAITDFVTAYNTVIQDLSSQFTFNTSTSTAGPLSGDAGARLVQSELLSAATYTATGTNNSFNTLASLGISMNDDGTLTVDNSALSSAVNSNFAGVQNFFNPATGTGFASSLADQLAPILDPTQGAFSIELKGMSDGQKSFQDQIDNYEIYIANEQTLLTQQYTQVDLALRQLPLLQQQINSELNFTGNSNNNSNNNG